MKSIKTFLPGCLLLFICTMQMANAQTKVGITAGSNLSNAYINYK